jgi:molybdopterin synthase sulfur carrier subunit
MDILLFGITREIIGKQKLTIPETEPIHTVAELKSWLSGQYPALKQLSSLAVAVDSAYAENEDALTVNSEVALIPPVSGG